MTIGHISEGTKYRVDGKLHTEGKTITLNDSTLYCKDNIAYFTDFNDEKSTIEVHAASSGQPLFDLLTKCTDMTLSIRN